MLYGHRWKIERMMAGIQNFRCLGVRYERKIPIFTAQLQPACTMIPSDGYETAS